MIKNKTTDQVEYFMRKWPKLKDDDNKLIATIWKWQIEDVIGANLSQILTNCLWKKLKQLK